MECASLKLLPGRKDHRLARVFPWQPETRIWLGGMQSFISTTVLELSRAIVTLQEGVIFSQPASLCVGD